jgi:hypothetical protein
MDEPKEVGTYEVIWDGRDDQGNEVASGVYLWNEVASGVYLCKLQVREQNQIKKMVLIK